MSPDFGPMSDTGAADPSCELALPEFGLVSAITTNDAATAVLVRSGHQRGIVATTAGARIGGGRLVDEDMDADGGPFALSAGASSWWMLTNDPQTLSGKVDHRVSVVELDASLTPIARFFVSRSADRLAVAGPIAATFDVHAGIDIWDLVGGSKVGHLDVDSNDKDLLTLALTPGKDTLLVYGARSYDSGVVRAFRIDAQTKEPTPAWTAAVAELRDVTVADERVVATGRGGITARSRTGDVAWTLPDLHPDLLTTLSNRTIVGVEDGVAYALSTEGELVWRVSLPSTLVATAIGPGGGGGIAVGGYNVATHAPMFLVLSADRGELQCPL